MDTSADTPATVDYRTVFHALPGMYLLLSLEGTILDNSDLHAANTLQAREEAVGRHMFEAYPADPESQRGPLESQEFVKTHLQPHTMAVARYDLQLAPEQGGGFQERYWQVAHYPIIDTAGGLRYLLQRSQDVTDQYAADRLREAAESSLAEIRQQSDFILENLPILLACTPPEGPSNYFNRRWREFTGRTSEGLLHNRWAECIHPDDIERLLGWRDAQRTAPNTSQIEFRLRRHDGEYRWMLARSLSHFGADGQLRQRVSCAIDIQEQKKLVQELRETAEQQAGLAGQTQQAFQQAQHQRDIFHQFFEQAPALICILRGSEHRYEFVNPGYQALFPHRRLVGRTVHEVLPEIASQGIIDILDNVFQTGQTFYGNEILIRLEHDATGQLHDAYFNFTYQQFRENDAPTGIIVFAFDVTDFVLARQRLEAYHRTG